MSNIINFTKMQGAGNDYIYVYLPDNPITSPSETSIEWSKYHFGIGSDGLILVDKSKVADFSMRIFNNDGSEAMMCGNGVRCVAKFVHDLGLIDDDSVTIETLSGIKTVKLFFDEKSGEVIKGRVDMGSPLLENRAQLATPQGKMIDGVVTLNGKEKYIGNYVCMGNPHFVTFVDDINKIDVSHIGPQLEHHEIFPERCNIEFAQKIDENKIRMRVWERGSGITMACGTGACATAVAACITGRTGRNTEIIMDGGTLSIDWDENDNHVYMTGPTVTVFKGQIIL